MVDERTRGVILRIAYDGTAFKGWAAQRDARTVEDTLRGAVLAMDPGAGELRGTSRTDAGVHAEGQVVAFDATRDIPAKGWVLGLDQHLPDDVSVRFARSGPVGFSPRFAARSKRYRYRLLVDPVRDPQWRTRAWRLEEVDVALLTLEAAAAVGTHDFAAFRGSADRRPTTIRSLLRVDVEPDPDGRIVAVVVQGDAFLYNMVRILVGTMADVSRGRLEPGAVARAIDARQRSVAGTTAPAHGLVLEWVDLRDASGGWRRMAALTRAHPMHVRAPRAGEGVRIAALWRELWESHERWGGYPGSRDARTYAQLAARLDEDARVRAGHPTLGRHIHLVAELGGVPCGQVEGWLEAHGSDATTPLTCEVRSLIVHESARQLGAGRALLDALASVARRTSQSTRCVLAAEVLESNPAQTFYTRVGYTAVSWNARMQAVLRPIPASFAPARLAGPQDAGAIARLEGSLATRRRVSGDVRFDAPRAVDATLVAAIASTLVSNAMVPNSVETLVALDSTGYPRAAASLVVHSLEPPFLPMRRALLGRVALDPASPARPLIAALLALARHRAALQQAPLLEVSDLPSSSSELYGAVLGNGAQAWSRIVLKEASSP